MEPQRPNLTFGKLVLGKMNIWEVDTSEKSFMKVPINVYQYDFNVVITLASSHIDFTGRGHSFTIPYQFTLLIL